MTEITLASLTQLLSDIGGAMTFIWSIFTSLCNTIATNSLMLYSVLASLAFAVIYTGYRVVRKFGLKGRR